MKINKDFILIGKSIFFLKEEILAMGDLQLGYDIMMQEAGMSLKLNQLEQTLKDLELIFKELKKRKLNIKKIILLGDIKHHFSYNKNEKYAIRDLLRFLDKKIGKENIILIKGNHEKFHLDNLKYLDFYITDSIAFIHGHKDFKETLDKKIKTKVIAHIHPAICLKDKQEVKKEKFKCFLIGKKKKQNLIILPSFFPLVEGTYINDLSYNQKQKNKDFSIINQKDLKNFNVFISSNNLEVLSFGKLKKLMN